MKLRLLSLVLLGITLLDVTQARTIEKKEINVEDYPGKREVNEEEDINIESDNSICSCNNGECNRCDYNGCQQVSNCNGKREVSTIDYADAEKLIKMFQADNSKCKCLNHGYCLARKDSKSEYTEVNGCGERKCYTHCDPSGCREVCDGQCECENYHCEHCDDKGCFQVSICYTAPGIVRDEATNCKVCRKDDVKVCPINTCDRLCNDKTGDRPVPQKCTCKKDENGKEKCKICDKFQCNPVPDCSTLATCDCRDDNYRRCIGYKHGELLCRTLYSCSEYEKRKEEWEMEYAKRNYDEWTVACECPANGGLCKICANNGFCYAGKWTNGVSCNAPLAYNVTAHLH